MRRGIIRSQLKENPDLRNWNVDKYTRLSDIRNNPMEVEGKQPDVLVAMLESRLNLLMVCHNGRKLEEVCISPLRFAHDVICKDNRVLICIKSQVDGRTNGKFRLRFPSNALCQSFCMFISNFLQVVGYDEWFQNTNLQSSSQTTHSNSSMATDSRMGSTLRNSSIGTIRSYTGTKNSGLADSSRPFDDTRMNTSSGFMRKHTSFRSDENGDYQEAPSRNYSSSDTSMTRTKAITAPQSRRNSYQRLDSKNIEMLDISCGEHAYSTDHSFVEITKTSQNYLVEETSPNFVANDTTTDGITITNPSLENEIKTSQSSGVSQLDKKPDYAAEMKEEKKSKILVASATQTDRVPIAQPNCVVNINIASLISDEAAARFTDMCKTLMSNLLKSRKANSTLSKPRAQREKVSNNTVNKKPRAKQETIEPDVERLVEAEQKKLSVKVKKPLKWLKQDISVKRCVPTNRRKTGYRLRGYETPVKRTNQSEEEKDFSD